MTDTSKKDLAKGAGSPWYLVIVWRAMEGKANLARRYGNLSLLPKMPGPAADIHSICAGSCNPH